FSNSEAAFQAQKFIHDPELMSQFTPLTGDQAFHKAREFSSKIRPDWMEVRVRIMKEVLAAKIDQNPLIASRLAATGDAFLVEHNPVKGRDAFWSDDCDGTGRNMLGILWMELRSEMQNF
ncbi:MAG TPA: NADAR family protein, partial [Chlamydiales bacterium]|nr:NADAR family protein [Chlamydiales bacterium]